MRRLLLLALLLPAPLSAGETWLRYDRYCTTGSFVSCASVDIQAVTTPTGTDLTLYVRNLQGTLPQDNTGGSTFSEIFFSTPPFAPGFDDSNGFIASGIHTVGSVRSWGPFPDQWDAYFGVHDPNTNREQFWLWPTTGSGAIVGCDVPARGPLNPLLGYYQTCPRQGFTGAVAVTFQFQQMTFAARDVQLTWATANATQGAVCRPGLTCFATATTAPEPATLALLVTGLVGLGGLPAVRRRSAPPTTQVGQTKEARI